MLHLKGIKSERKQEANGNGPPAMAAILSMCPGKGSMGECVRVHLWVLCDANMGAWCCAHRGPMSDVTQCIPQYHRETFLFNFLISSLSFR